MIMPCASQFPDEFEDADGAWETLGVEPIPVIENDSGSEEK